ncbi:uncharacterized protein LOC112507891 [Cynara cardunculus var. scolymus]|uniref:Concanavalin A-like lectin/glucanase superfamily n=1 Tax=Cynara cardunculus var. scolymus TaxID=59895 RepID=A0A103YL83_CYNCS|nr:uncharacterized protein LOC112507891 [Cynara cardunculus var. scolymus]KVI11201.1 Protein of unknown function DUF1191 [Cynara cardunculus var. scolymus]
MGLQFRSLSMLVLLVWLYWWPRVESQVPGPEIRSAKALDVILQDYAYRAFVRPRTGIPYDGAPPSNLSGIQISAMRLRSGSLYMRGVQMYKEFTIPVGVREEPYVERLVLVYQNLGNWSTAYYRLPGFMYLAPILGLLAYDASNLSAKNLRELHVRASEEPISIEFRQVKPVPDGSIARCVWFDLNGRTNFTNVTSGNKCATFEQGHFSIVVESTAPSPSPASPIPQVPTPSHGGGGNNSKVWTIVGSVIGGVALLVLLALLMLLAWRFNKRKKMHRMEKAAEAGEALHMTTVGNTKAPAATTTRTQPTLETEYVP